MPTDPDASPAGELRPDAVRTGTSVRRWPWYVQVVVGLAVSLLLLEGALQIASLGAWMYFRRKPAPKVEQDARVVLCVGDSYTYGMGGSGRESSYPSQLQARLRKRTRAPWHVENAGWPGRNSREVLEHLPRLLSLHRPAFVLIMVGANDVWSKPQPSKLDPNGIPRGADSSLRNGYRWRWRTGRLLRLLLGRSRAAASGASNESSEDSPEGRRPSAVTSPAKAPPFAPGLPEGSPLVGRWVLRNAPARTEVTIYQNGTIAMGSPLLQRVAMIATAAPGELRLWEPSSDSDLRFKILTGEGPMRLAGPDGKHYELQPIRQSTRELEVPLGRCVPPVEAAALDPGTPLIGLWMAHPEGEGHSEALEIASDGTLSVGPRRLRWTMDGSRFTAVDGPFRASFSVRRSVNGTRVLEDIDSGTLVRLVPRPLQVESAEEASQDGEQSLVSKDGKRRGFFVDEKSLKAAKAKVDLENGSAEGWRAYAWQLFQLGQSVKALEALEAALARAGDDRAFRTRCLVLRANILRGAGTKGYLCAIVEAFSLDRDPGFLRQAAIDARDASELDACMTELRLDPAVARLAREEFEKARDTRDVTRNLASHLETAAELCLRAGAQPILLSYPFPTRPIDQALRLVKTRRDVSVVDLAAPFERIRASEAGAALFAPDGHCNDRGYFEIARVVAEELIRESSSPCPPALPWSPSRQTDGLRQRP